MPFGPRMQTCNCLLSNVLFDFFSFCFDGTSISESLFLDQLIAECWMNNGYIGKSLYQTKNCFQLSERCDAKRIHTKINIRKTLLFFQIGLISIIRIMENCLPASLMTNATNRYLYISAVCVCVCVVFLCFRSFFVMINDMFGFRRLRWLIGLIDSKEKIFAVALAWKWNNPGSDRGPGMLAWTNIYYIFWPRRWHHFDCMRTYCFGFVAE